MNLASLPKTSGHVLWLTPEGEAAALLSGWIRRLADLLDGPIFAPHVTLLGGLEDGAKLLSDTLSSLAQGVAPFELATEGVAFQENPFRALCLPAATSEGLWRARQAVQPLDRSRGLEPYFPHVSLYYGHACLAKRMEALGALGPPPCVHFPVTALHLVSAEGRPEEWRAMESFPLEGSSAR